MADHATPRDRHGSAEPSGLPAWLRSSAPYEAPALDYSGDLVTSPVVGPDDVDDEAPSEGSGDAPVAEEQWVDEELYGSPPPSSPPAPATPGTIGQEPISAEPVASKPDDLTSKMVQWSRRRGAGLLLSGIAGGLQQVFEPDGRAEIVMEVPAAGPEDHRAVRLVFVPGDPKASIAFIRPWLLPRHTPPRA